MWSDNQERRLTDLLETLKRALGNSYTFQRELLGGGMSRVFVAFDETLGRQVAVKVLLPEVAAEIKTERFRQEIQLAAKLQHPHIVPLLFAGERNGILYFTMPFIEGESLRQRINRDGALPISEAVRTLRQVASALAYAHKQGIVHRDIKPDNVLLSDEFALVTDFGVAKALSASTTSDEQPLTSAGMAVGTPAYMSPEQALADTIDHRADIYAFGVVAYELLTGAPPFRGPSAQATLAAHVTQAPEHLRARRPEVPEELANTIMRCLEKKPEDRPASASEIQQLLDAVPVSGGSIPTIERAMPPRAPNTRLRLGLAAAGILLLAAVAYPLLKNRGTQAASTDFSSVAVLPLVNVGGDQNDEYFSDGMTDELANALSRLPGLRVASRTSSYAFKGRANDVGEIGRKLRVQTVLEGTVRRAGRRLRVTAQLTNVSDGLAIWSNAYERETRDVFAVQDEIARAIAEALRPRLGARAQTLGSESRGTTNLEAYDQYLRGRFFWNRRGAENLRRAIEYFDGAIALDPRFARAHAGRALAYTLLPEYTDAPPPNASAITREAAARALSLDSTLAEAYTALGLAGVHDWNFREAEAAYRKALELDPRYATAQQWYGELLYHTGRIDSSLARMRIAAELDPLAPIIPAALAYPLSLAGKSDSAISTLRQGIELAQTLALHRLMLGIVYLMRGDHRRALTELEAAVRLEPELSVWHGYVAYARARLGDTERAQEITQRLEQQVRAGRASPMGLAVARLGMNQHDLALTALEQAVDRHDISLLTTSSPLPDPIFDPVRSNPRFQEILRRMNLLEYAAAAGKR